MAVSVESASGLGFLRLPPGSVRRNTVDEGQTGGAGWHVSENRERTEPTEKPTRLVSTPRGVGKGSPFSTNRSRASG
ncbi:hypothetical protein ZHAS_00013909 [Anopheles sinensis]|uniref:Uncharacterized protein n=1 Tax=Anopheles sinensis TaxID=74873 RepID=A0A084W6R5_ANOSI|nr:hypothetical protein ZHAS_00013909 [Anopheles sinensis]